MLDPKDEKNSRDPASSPHDGHGLSRPGAEVTRSLSTEMPYTLTARNISRDTLDRILQEIMPDLAHLISGELFDLVGEGRCFKGEQLRSKYFAPAPISIHQHRTFVLSKNDKPKEQLHSVKIIDERCHPESPTIELFQLGALRTPVSVRFSFDTLPAAERWALVNRLGAFLGIADVTASFVRLPREAEHACSSGSTMLEVGPDTIIETLSTTQPLSPPKSFADRESGRRSWTIDSLEYSQPDYQEQGALLKLVDPREFQPVTERNLLSSLLLHTARMYATQEGEISLSKLTRASRHISEPLTLVFERWMAMGDPDIDEPTMSEELLALLASDPDNELEWSALEEAESHGEEPSPGSRLEDEVPAGNVEENEAHSDSQDADVEDIPDFGTRSRVTLEKRSSPYGAYCISFSSDASGLTSDQVNDDSFFNKDAPTIRVDFLDNRNARSRWRLLSKLHGELAESMAVPEDEAHNLDAIERDFSASDLPASGEQVALYLGRMRVIASRD